MAAQRNHKLDKVIGDNLRRARRKRGFTQQQLAALVHVAYQQIQKYEDGLVQMPVATAFRLVSHLDITADALFAGLDGTKRSAEDDRDAFRLARALQRIKSPRTRDVVVQLVNSLAGLGQGSVGAHPLPAATLETRIAIVGTAGSGKTYAAKGLVEILIGRGERVCIVDPLGVWYGLRLAVDGKPPGFPVVIFGGAHADVPIDETVAPALAEIIGTTDMRAIVDLSGLDNFTARKRFMKEFAEALYRHNREPLHLVLDEADLWAPQQPINDGVSPILKNRIDEIVRRGRVLGFVPWLITQRPAVIHKDILSQLDTLIAFKLTSSQDRDALSAWLEGQADRATGRDLIGSLPRLEQGSALCWSPGIGLLDTLRFPPNRSFDSSRTPKRGERARVTLAPLDLGQLRERLVAATAHAAENDPKAMRATLAGLRQQIADLKKRPAGPTPAEAAARAGALAAVRELGEQLRNVRVHLRELRAQSDSAIDRVLTTVEALGGALGGLDAAPAQFPATTGDAPQARARPQDEGNGEDRTVRRRGDGAHLRLVKALAERHPRSFARGAVATLAGLNPRGGTFSKYLSLAKTAGLIAAEAGLWQATALGLGLALELPEQAPTAQHLVALWRGVIGGGGVRRMLDALLDAYPQTMDRGSLADRCNMTTSGGTFAKYLSVLKTNGLATVAGRRVSAAAILFEDANQGGDDGELAHNAARHRAGRTDGDDDRGA